MTNTMVLEIIKLSTQLLIFLHILLICRHGHCPGVRVCEPAKNPEETQDFCFIPKSQNNYI